MTPVNPARNPNQVAAHQFLSELRTRVITQPLPYQYGVENRALESLWEIFGQARKAMEDNPGCEEFARETTRMLNVDLRPVTAKWHRAHAEGRLNSRDGANDFRVDLGELRKRLREFSVKLHEMAYGIAAADDETPPAMPSDLVDDLMGNLRFGIPHGNGLIDAERTGEINKAEYEEVARRRAQYGIAKDRPNAVGLGLSGGGIRSATFCLGVVQVLAGKELLRDVDFLSTVSGGGYLGTYLSTIMRDAESERQLGVPRGPDSPPIQHLRRGAKYLSATNLKGRWALVTATFAGMMLNWTAPLFVAALTTLAASLLTFPIPWRELVLSLVAINCALLLGYAAQMRYGEATMGRLLGLSAAATLAVLSCWILSYFYAQIIMPPGIALLDANFLSLAALSAALPAVVRFVPIARTPAANRVLMRIMLFVAGLLVPIGAIGTVFALYYLGSEIEFGRMWLSLLTAAFGLVALFLLDVNVTAPHRIYRDHLARTFIAPTPFAATSSGRGNDTAVLSLGTGQETPSRIPLSTLNAEGFAPYHLINAVVNLPSSTNTKLRERKSDFYLFSKAWCGAPSLGYAASDEWRSREGPVDLATAMAVSGAAASSHMGAASVPSLSALLTLLNVRLGYWIRRPSAKTGSQVPGFSCLVREMLGVGMSEDARWINLSDGGHLENMGVIELLRRRCKFIISVDGEADRDSTFHGHLTLVRHAQIDFGIRIEPDLTALRPATVSSFSASHALMCRVHYPQIGDDPGGVGLILYLKLSMTGDEIELVKRYRTANPDFPHQSTLDQFFDEEQFEAYRQLGVHVAEGLFHRALVGDGTDPKTVADWFRALAASLLLPES